MIKNITLSNDRILLHKRLKSHQIRGVHKLEKIIQNHFSFINYIHKQNPSTYWILSNQKVLSNTNV